MKKSQSQHLLDHNQQNQQFRMNYKQTYNNHEENINRSFEEQDHTYPLLENNPNNLQGKNKNPYISDQRKQPKNIKEPKKNNKNYQKIPNEYIEMERLQPNPTYNQQQQQQQIRRQHTVPNMNPQIAPLQLVPVTPIYYNPNTTVSIQPIYPITYSPRNVRQLTVTINGRNFFSPRVYTAQMWVQNAVPLQSIPNMKVKCSKCAFSQFIPATQTVYKCWKCSTINNCQPTHGSFICFNCKNIIYFPYKLTNLICCSYCKFVNKVDISDPNQLLKNTQRISQNRNMRK